MILKCYKIILSGFFLFILFLIPHHSYGDGGYFSPPHRYQYRINNEIIELLQDKIDPEKLEFIENKLISHGDFFFHTREELTSKVKALNNEEIWLILDYADISSKYRINDEVLYKLKSQIYSDNFKKLDSLKGTFYKADLLSNLKKLDLSNKEIEYVIFYAGKGAKQRSNTERYLFNDNYCPRGLDINHDSIELFYDTYLSPSQEGIITFSKGKETLIIKVPAMEIPDFAWVVPVPSYPEVKKADQMFFSLLSDAIREDLFSNKKIWYLTAYKPGGGLILDGGGYTPSKPDTVKVFEKKIVGNFETVILSAENPDDLVNWLNKNQFYFPEKARETIEFYTKKHWYFVAMKIRNPELLNELHPVEFTFETEQPVYPMKITSVNEGESRVNLYIFSDRERGCPWMYRIWDGDYHRLSSVVSHIRDYPSHLTVISGKIPNNDIKDDITLKPMSSYELSITGLLNIIYLLLVAVISGVVLYLYRKKNINILSDFTISMFIMAGIILFFYYILIFLNDMSEYRWLYPDYWYDLLVAVGIISGMVLYMILYLYRKKNVRFLNVFSISLFTMITIFWFFSYICSDTPMFSLDISRDKLSYIVYSKIPLLAVAIMCGIIFYFYKKKDTKIFETSVIPTIMMTGTFLFLQYVVVPTHRQLHWKLFEEIHKAELLLPVILLLTVVAIFVICVIGLYFYEKNMKFTNNFTVTLFVMISIFLFVYYIIIPNFSLARSRRYSEKCTEICESNIKNLTTALEIYATDNIGTYPTQLSQLTLSAGPDGGYMKVIPVCPISNKNTPTYVYMATTNPDDFFIFCICKHNMELSHAPVVFPRCGEWHITGNYSPILDEKEIEKIKEIESIEN